MVNLDMNDFDLFNFDVSNLDMTALDAPTLDMFNLESPDFDIAANGNAPDADLDVIDDLAVPSADKKWIFDVLLKRHVKRATGKAPQDDASWPTPSELQQAYVQKLFESITDLSNFFELRKARERLGKIEHTQQERSSPDVAEKPRKRRRGLGEEDAGPDRPERPKGMSKTDWTLVNDQNTPVDLLEAVIHHRISGVEVELLCWRLLRCAMDQQQGFTMRPLWSGSRTVSTWEHFDAFSDRWQSICDNLRTGSASMPVHRRRNEARKLSNDLLNGRRDIQNQVGRDIIKKKTSKQDWIASDDFEIRDKAGELVLKGGHLGDKKRRQLAVTEMV
ncbi:hypothetical protein BDP81DRAFT_398526 [Colletotrichum phormii]|uniref:Uncharacterized protein n=1 Tax=Colletotrichum phormii TaxID=359342 RepID=A0AAI9ZJC6_9PEZI|nr:uncharacterized protein BDP81DRAFT_398526 [Colletotrichum phormii]KAK1624441.1 hypothetical protein BDP81DRAFT_398526 [Colletotrichum phormii]